MRSEWLRLRRSFDVRARDTEAVLELGSGSGTVGFIAAQVVELFGSRAALNYMIVSDCRDA